MSRLIDLINNPHGHEELRKNLESSYDRSHIRSWPRIINYDHSDIIADIEGLYDHFEDLRDILDITTLKRGGILAIDPDYFIPPPQEGSAGVDLSDHSPDGGQGPTHTFLTTDQRRLTHTEARALDRERRGVLGSLTKGMKLVIGTCAAGAITQGWSQECIVGANLTWPVDLGIASRNTDGSLDFDPDNGLIYFGLVTAIPYFAASVIGAGISDPLSHKFGRRTALLSAAICSLAAPIGAAFCQTWFQLLVCRLIAGVGMGAKSSIVPILESETSKPEMRGRILVSWQTFVAFGIFLGAAANLIFSYNWRLQIGIAFVPAVALLCMCFTISETPRWWLKRGNPKKAYRALRDLRQTPLQAARDLYLIWVQSAVETLLLQERMTAKGPTHHAEFFKRFTQLFTISRNRRAAYGCCAAMIAQQFSGINVFAFLGTTILNSSGVPSKTNMEFDLAFGAVNALCSASAYLLIDRFGRRSLLLWSLFLMFPFLLAAGHFLDAGNDAGAVVAILLYTAFYSPGAGVIPWMYTSEIFPLVHREAGMSLGCAVTFSFAGALALAVPQYSRRLNDEHLHFTLLGAFAGFDFFAAILVWLLMRSPEEPTSLEDMTFFFGAPTQRHFKYQVQVALPWFVKYLPSLLRRGFVEPKDAFEDWNPENSSEEERFGSESSPN